MAEPNMIDDVRSAKVSVDSTAATLDVLFARLVATEQAYLARSGSYASIPRQRHPDIQKMIDKAQDEPGHELLSETRTARPA